MRPTLKYDTEKMLSKLDQIIDQLETTPEKSEIYREEYYNDLRILGIKIRKLQKILNRETGKHQRVPL